MTFALHISGDQPVPQFKGCWQTIQVLSCLEASGFLRRRGQQNAASSVCPIIRSLFCTMCIADVTADMHSIRDCQPLELTFMHTVPASTRQRQDAARDRISVRLNHVLNAAGLVWQAVTSILYRHISSLLVYLLFSDPLSASILRDSSLVHDCVDWRGVAQSETSFRGSVFLRVTSTTS